MFIAELYIDCD